MEERKEEVLAMGGRWVFGGGEGREGGRVCTRGHIWPCGSPSLCWLVRHARPPEVLNMRSQHVLAAQTHRREKTIQVHR